MKVIQKCRTGYSAHLLRVKKGKTMRINIVLSFVSILVISTNSFAQSNKEMNRKLPSGIVLNSIALDAAAKILGLYSYGTLTPDKWYIEIINGQQQSLPSEEEITGVGNISFNSRAKLTNNTGNAWSSSITPYASLKVYVVGSPSFYASAKVNLIHPVTGTTYEAKRINATGKDQDSTEAWFTGLLLQNGEVMQMGGNGYVSIAHT